MLTIRPFSLAILIILTPLFIACSGKTGNPASPQEHAVTASPQQEPDALPDQPNPTSPYYIPQTKSLRELALQEAALNGQTRKVENLLGHGVDANAVDPGRRTALMYSSYNGHTEIVQMLLDSGAEPGLRDAMGRTALLFASTGQFPETVKLLLENNADPNIRDAGEQFTPLMHAAAEGHLEVVKILLKYGADPSLKDVDGENAELFARQNGHTEVAELLKSK